MAERGRFFDGQSGKANREILFVVEGVDDAFFIDSILNEFGADPSLVGVVYTGGKDKLETGLGSLLRTTLVVQRQVKRYAIISDSDNDPRAERDRIHRSLVRLGQPTPEHGNRLGMNPEVGLFLMPSGQQPGCLESLLLDTIKTDPRLIFVERFFTGFQDAFGALDSPAKRLCRIYLDCCGSDYRGAGRAYRAGMFDHSNPVLAEIRMFLKRFIT